MTAVFPSLVPSVSSRPGLPAGIGYTSGQYYPLGVIDGSLESAGLTLTGGLDCFFPFVCRQSWTFDRIALYNTAAVATQFRLAIYADDGGGRPGALVADSGALTCGGAAGDNAGVISAALVGGRLYWLAFNAAANLAVVCLGSTRYPGFGNIADLVAPAGTGAGAVLCATRAHAAFPATASAVTSIQNQGPPFIRVRAA